MKSSLRQFWSRLNGSVHPDDALAFKSARHSFNLDFPPPAFIGDVDNAPVVILMANGGFGSATSREFPKQEDVQEYIDWLTGRRLAAPTNLSNYYTKNSYYRSIEAGKAVLVNAVAYRSPKISKEPENAKFGKTLPSYRAHLNWLNNELIPQVKEGKRLVIAHRYTLWGLSSSQAIAENFIFSKNSVSESLSKETLQKVKEWQPTAPLHEQ